MDSNSRLLETEKILVVTVLEGLYIITTDVSAPENKNKVITLAYSEDFFSRLGLGFEPKSFRKGGFNLNTISGISSVVKSRGFENVKLVTVVIETNHRKSH
jgi:hypothetical protein